MAGPAPLEHGIDLRIWRACRILAAAPDVHRRADSGNGLRGCDSPAALAPAGCCDAGCGLGNCLPWPEMDRVQGLRAAKDEAADMAEAIAIHEQVTGSKPRGWYTGRCSVNTVDLATETGILDYVSDSYADDLPYWHHHQGPRPAGHSLYAGCQRHAVCNPAGFDSGDPFFQYLKDTFDVLYAEGRAGSPKMMNIGLHCRLAGQAGTGCSASAVHGLCQKPQGCVVCTAYRDCRTLGKASSCGPGSMFVRQHLKKPDFVTRFGGVFEHSAWIAERAFDW